MKKEAESGYITKRILKANSKQAFSVAATKSIDIMGYVVIVEDGWIQKRYKDGHVEKMEQLIMGDRTPFDLD